MLLQPVRMQRLVDNPKRIYMLESRLRTAETERQEIDEYKISRFPRSFLNNQR